MTARDLLQDKRTLWMVAVIIALVFAATNLPWQLDDYDQAKQAFTSFEMVKEGHWLYQRTPQGRVATKPPLAGWISAGVFEVTRSWDFAWRLPSLAAAAAIAVLLFRAGSLYGAAAGLLALSAFGLNLLSSRLSSLVRTDMLLALVIFLIGLASWRKIQTNEGWTIRDRWWVFALLTAGMLIKGPIVYAFLLPGIVGYQFWRWNHRDAVSAWCGWWPWVASLAIFLLWAFGGIRTVPGFYEQVVVREFMGRFGETIHRPQPIYFYFPHLLHKFAPWSVLLLGLGFVAVKAQGRIRSALAQIKPETAWLLFWILGGLILMSLIPSKRVDRIFPVIPPLCLLLASQIGRAVSDGPGKPRVYFWAALSLVGAILFTGGYSGFKVISGYRENRGALVDFGRAVQARAAANQWRYAVASGGDEGMLLYLNKTRFIEPRNAITQWNDGNLEALIVPRDEIASYQRDLTKASSVELESALRKEERGGYVLLVRAKP